MRLVPPEWESHVVAQVGDGERRGDPFVSGNTTRLTAVETTVSTRDGGLRRGEAKVDSSSASTLRARSPAVPEQDSTMVTQVTTKTMTKREERGVEGAEAAMTEMAE